MNPYHALLGTTPTASSASESDTPILYTDADLEEMAQRILPKTTALSRSTKLRHDTPYNKHMHKKKLSLSLPALVGHALHTQHMVTSSNPVSRRASLQSAIRRASFMSSASTPDRAGKQKSNDENTPEEASDTDHSYVLKLALDHTDTTITVDGLDLADLNTEEVEEGGEDVDSQDSTWVTRGSVGSCDTTNNKRNTTTNSIPSMKAVVKSILEQHRIQVEALVKCKQELFYHYQTQYDNACQLREKMNYMKGHNSDLLDQEREKYMLLHDEYMILKEATSTTTATATPLIHTAKVTTHIKPTVLQMISPKISASAAKKPGAGNTTNNTYDMNLCDFNEDDDTATVNHTTTMHDNDENKSPTNCLSIYSTASTNTNTASTVLKKPVRPLDDKLQVPGLLPKFTLHMPSLEESLIVRHVAIPPTDTDLFTYSAPNTGKEGHNYDLNDDDMYEVSSPNIHTRDRLSCLTPNEPVDSATTSLISSKLQCIRDLNLTSLFSKICDYRKLSITEKNDISTLISEIQDEIKLIQELDIHERDDASKLMRELQEETNMIMTEKNELLVTIERSAIEYLNSSGEFYAERRKLHDRIASLEYLSSQLQIKLDARGGGSDATTGAYAEHGTPVSECDTIPAVHDQSESDKDAALLALQVEYGAIQAQRDDLITQLHAVTTEYTTLRTQHTETLSHLSLLEQQLQHQSPYNQHHHHHQNNDQTDELELLNKRVLELTNVLEHLQNTTNIEKTLLKSRILKLNTQMNVIRDENIIERDSLLSEINSLKASIAYNNKTTTNDNNDGIHDNNNNSISVNGVYNNNTNSNLYSDNNTTDTNNNSNNNNNNNSNIVVNNVVVEEDEIPSPRNTEISIILMELADIKKDRSALKETVKNQLHMLNTLKIESDEDLFNLQLSHDDEIKEVSDRLIVIEDENKRISYENNVLIKQVDTLTLQLIELKKDKADLTTQLQSKSSLISISHTVPPEVNTIPPTAAPVPILLNTTATTTTAANKSKGEQIYANLVQTKAWQREKLVYEEKWVILNRQYDECKVECEELRRQLHLQQGRQVREEEEEEDKREVLYSILGTSSSAPSYPTTQTHTHTNTASGMGIAFPSNQATSNYTMKDAASSPISTHPTTNNRTTTATPTANNSINTNTVVSARKSVVKLKPVTDSKVILQKIKKLDEKLNSPNKDNNNTNNNNTTNNKKTHYSRSRKTKNGRRDTNLWFEDNGHNSDRNGNNSNGNEFLRAHREIAEMWARQYQALIEYTNIYGHCNVPYTYVHDCESVPLGKKEVIGSVVSRLNLG